MAGTEKTRLLREIHALEKRLNVPTRGRQASRDIMAEIHDMEARLNIAEDDDEGEDKEVEASFEDELLEDELLEDELLEDELEDEILEDELLEDELEEDEILEDEFEDEFIASDDDDEDDDDEESDEEDESDDESVVASEVDPDGIEEQITQDYLRAVQSLRHGEQLTSGPSMGSVAPTRSEYVAKLRSVSARLDRVATILEKEGRKQLAFRVDKVADAVDARIRQLQGGSK